MKKMLFAHLLLFASLFTAQAQTATDEAAIKTVVEAESRAWLAADPTAFNDCWRVQPYTRILVSLEDGTCYDIGSDQMKAATADAMGKGGSFQNSNYRSRISTDLAWLTYDEVKTDPTTA